MAKNMSLSKSMCVLMKVVVRTPQQLKKALIHVLLCSVFSKFTKLLLPLFGFCRSGLYLECFMLLCKSVSHL